MQRREITWTPRNGGGLITVIDNLGIIEIYRDSNGNCVDINSKRAWSAWKANENQIRMQMNQHIRNWDYLNSFKGQ
jgi:hypothetical protein